MNQNSELFELIKSLDKNEKRYFRLQSSLQKGNKNYIKLFNAIDKQKYYDEEKIRKQNANEKFTRQLAFTKNHLYGLIIKSLISYNSEKSIDSRIHSAISECKILFRKALYRQYFYKITKTKQLCLKYERFGYFLQILDIEKIIIRKQEIQTIKGTAIYNEALDAIEKLRNIFEYYRLGGYSLYNYRTTGTRRNKKHDEETGRILNSEIMSSPENAVSIRSRESYFRIREIIYNTEADYKKMLKAIEKRYETVRDYPFPFEDYIIDYTGDTLSALVDAYLKGNDIEKTKEFLKIFEDLRVQNDAERVDKEIFVLFTKFKILIKQDEITKASEYIPKLEGLLVKYKDKILIDTELSIMFHIVKCRMLEKNFEKALSASNALLTHPLLEKRKDYQSYLLVMNLIIHFELKNFSLLKYLIISTYRFLYKREKLYEIESIILKFIRKLPELKNEDDLVYTFIIFKKRLGKLKKNKYEKNAFEYFDFLRWIEEKIKK